MRCDFLYHIRYFVEADEVLKNNWHELTANFDQARKGVEAEITWPPQQLL